MRKWGNCGNVKMCKCNGTRVFHFLIFALAMQLATWAGGQEALWIGAADEAEMTWRDEDARRCRGITGGKGHDLILSNRLAKTTSRLRKVFSLPDKPIVKATAVASGMGFYELWMNGAKVDPTRVLAPGMAKSRTLADAYDVTKMLKSGTENAVGFWLAPGYSDDFSRFGWMWLSPKRAVLTLTVAYADGSTDQIVTDGSWESTDATPVLSASIYHGEVCDAGREDALWATPRGAKTGWKPVTVFPDGPATTVNTAPPVRLCERFRPVSVVESEPGVYTVDFGQNLAGVVRLRARGARGTKITVATAELLDEKGRITQWTNNGAKATDTFILAGTGEVEEFTPRFTYHGFQFAEVRGYPGKLTADDLESVAVHADVRRTSSFRCSDETLNWLHRAATWSILSNLMSYPTDCCMRRERTPCRMDSICYEDVACTLFDMRGYYPKWLADNVSAFDGGSPDNDGEPTFLATRLWHHYGTRAFADRHYDDMLRYLRGLEAKWPTGVIDKTYGDWCAPNAGTWETYFNDIEVVNVSLYAKLLGDVAEVAQARGREDDAERLRKRLTDVKAVLNSKLYSAERGEYGDGSQTTAVLPLAFGLVPDGERAKVVAALLRRIRGKDGCKIDTGIFGTRYIGEVLCDLGESDLLMELYTQKDYPGFGYMKKMGATTLWEQWKYKGGMHSHNHAMNAGGISWLYTRLAGIRFTKPGGTGLLVKPCFPQKLQFVEATQMTVGGEVGVRWQREKDGVRVETTVPANVCATLELPDGTRHALRPGEREVFRVRGI